MEIFRTLLSRRGITCLLNTIESSHHTIAEWSILFLEDLYSRSLSTVVQVAEMERSQVAEMGMSFNSQKLNVLNANEYICYLNSG
jgi:hypothetical protein